MIDRRELFKILFGITAGAMIGTMIGTEIPSPPEAPDRSELPHPRYVSDVELQRSANYIEDVTGFRPTLCLQKRKSRTIPPRDWVKM